MAYAVERILAASTPSFHVDATVIRRSLTASNFVAIRTIAGGPAAEALDPEILRAQQRCRLDRAWIDARAAQGREASEQIQLAKTGLLRSNS
jgi:argininosuccinate lyase